MKESEKIELKKWLTHEQGHTETIFLHFEGGGWVAYGHSALLLRQQVPGVKVKTVSCDGQRVPRAEWRGRMCFGTGAPNPRGGVYDISMPNPALIVIRRIESPKTYAPNAVCTHPEGIHFEIPNVKTDGTPELK